MPTTLTTADETLRESVLKHLSHYPDFDAALIGVSAKDGIVTLSGYVDTYAGKLAAERAARRMYGVKAVANELDVRVSHDRIDPDIAKDAVQALKNHVNVPPGLEVSVRDGHITLNGTVGWMFEKVAAERAVKYLRGVRGVSNEIVIKPRVSPRDVQKRITEALHRHADVDARRIQVEVEGGQVILNGNVRSWMERDEAVRAAWATPGVGVVDSRIKVIP
jgi:osmotically-inducible protein OsmY